MTASQRLSELFDRGLQNGLGSLSADELDLYRIQDFIIEYEMNGLSGYFYNRLSDTAQIQATISAMHRYNMTELRDLLTGAFGLFRMYDASNAQGSWSDVLKKLDPGDQLDSISHKIYAIDDYGLANSSIA